MWRKNRFPTGNVYGVDVNRNFEHGKINIVLSTG